MALTEKTFTDKIEITAIKDYYHMSVREARVFMDDGEVVAQKNHRYGLEPNSDTSQADSFVKSVFSAIMTDDVKAAHLSAVED